MSTQSTISKKAAITDPDQMRGDQPKRKRMTVPDFMARKGGDPLVCLTSYTAHVAHICDQVCDLLLVGDSLGMVIHGMPNTLGVTLEHMIMHGQAVVRGADKALVAVDMPFGSFEESPEVAFRNASRVVKETGCHAVKLEGGVEMAPTIRYLASRGIPVMGWARVCTRSLRMSWRFS
jgi:3-methyl-2-oxobutanoate hydroxymethyltransferase